MEKYNKLKKLSALFLIELVILMPFYVVGVFGQESTVPKLDVILPSYYNANEIDITGDVEPNSVVTLYVNNFNLARNKVTIGEEGKINFRGVFLETGVNKIRLTVSKDGLTTTKDFAITVDTMKPILDVNKLPSITIEKELTVSGSVDEKSTLNFYISKAGDDKLPEKVSGFKIDKIEQNLIQLSWEPNKDEDFAMYIVYREDVGPIFVATSQDYTSYSDVLVNSNVEYKYWVSVIDTTNKESPKSDILTAKTFSGGDTNIPSPNKVDITISMSPIKTLEVDKEFNVKLEFEKDNYYQLKIEATDLAGNKDVFEHRIRVDTTKPELKEINPMSGTRIYENVAEQVVIDGITTPNAKVRLYVNKSMDEKPDKETTASDEGKFVFEKVDLTKSVAGFEPEQISPTEFERVPYRPELYGPSREVNLFLNATDLFGRSVAAPLTYTIVNCWSGNLSWNIVPLIKYQAPPLLSVERIADGTEELSFLFNFSYQGIGTNGRIRSVVLERACDEYSRRDSRYNLSCALMENTCNIFKPTDQQDRTTWYARCKLKRYDEMNKWTADQWKQFFKDTLSEAGKLVPGGAYTGGLTSTLVFPFRLRIAYEHNVDGRTVAEMQTVCEAVTYVLDNSKINPQDVLPDWLLKGGIDWLDKSIEGIDKASRYVSSALRYLGIGCIASFGVRFLAQVFRRVACHYDNFESASGELLKKTGVVPETDLNEECTKCVGEEIKKRDTEAGLIDKLKDILDYFKLKGILKQSELSDTCLKKCAPTCSAAWEWEAKLYKVYRGLCDRVFCHTTPSKWTEDETNEDIYNKFVAGDRCEYDETALGQSVAKVKCKDEASGYLVSPDIFKETDNCVKINKGKDTVLCKIMKPTQENSEKRGAGVEVYELNCYERGGGSARTEYAIKKTDRLYLTKQSKTCKEVCGFADEEEGFKLIKDGKEIPFSKTTKAKPLTYGYNCMKVSECRALNSYPELIHQDLKIGEIRATTAGFTEDCFFPEHSVSNNANEREECCCINGEVDKEVNYYKPSDVETVDGTPPPDSPSIKTPEALKNMKWSYRYWKEKWKAPSGANEYNPDRYISGRDSTACFGQNNLIYDGAEGGHLVTINPFQQHTSAIQCLCVSGIYNRLQLLKNMLTAMSSCLKTVREQGGADSGACKELFSQYVCSLLWRIITFSRDGCLSDERGKDYTKQDQGFGEFLKTGLSGVMESVRDSQNEIAEEYGNVQLNNLLGVGEEAVARKACLAAFGYDWGVSMNDFVDVAYATPYGTLVQAITGRREYLSFDPINGQSRYEYRGSWIINPGCDLDDYDVYLSCITRKELDQYPGTDCSSQEDPKGINCDCLNLDGEKYILFKDGRAISQGTLVDEDEHRIIPHIYRFDHFKFVLKPDRRIKQELIDKCFTTGHEDGVYYFPLKDWTKTDIAACSYNPSTGQFTCSGGDIFFGKKGNAYFDKVLVTIDKTDYDPDDPARQGQNLKAREGNSLSIKPTIYKVPGDPVCLKMALSNQAKEETNTYEPILLDGLNQIPQIEIIKNLEISGVGDIVWPNGLDAAIYGEQTYEPGDTFDIEFKEGITDDDNIDLTKNSKDKVKFVIDKEFYNKLNNPDIKADTEGYMTISELNFTEDSKPTIAFKTGLVIKVEQVTLKNRVNIVGNNQKEDTVDFTIKTTGARQGETKTLHLELLRMKEGVKASEELWAPNDCDPSSVIYYNDVKQTKDYYIIVEKK